MRSFNSLLVLTLSFVTLVASGPLHPNTHSSRFAKNPVSSRQFHYPRALVDVCANVDLSLLSDLGSLFGHVCLCLSSFPFDLSINADLKLLTKAPSQTQVQARLKTLVEGGGTQCTYPDHASPTCTSGNPCDFTCADGFIKRGASCVCSSPNSVCNGKCGAYPRGCSSALPMPPKMTRRSVISPRNAAASGSHSRDLLTTDSSINLDSDGLVSNLLASLGITPSGSGIDADLYTFDNQILSSLDIDVPISGATTDLKATLNICVGAGVPDNFIGATTKVINSFLSLLLETTLNLEVDLSCSSPADPNTIAFDLQICGSSSDSLGAILSGALKKVADLLNGVLTDVEIATDCIVGGSGCPATPTLSSSNMPPPSPSPSSTLDAINLSGLLGQIEGILADLRLGPANYTLGNVTDITVGLFVVLSDTLNSVDRLVDAIPPLVDEILEELMGTGITVKTSPDPTPTPTPSTLSSGDDLVVYIDLGTIPNGLLFNTGDLVDAILSGVSEVLARLLNLNVVTNVDGGSGCGCSGSRRASAKS